MRTSSIENKFIHFPGERRRVDDGDDDDDDDEEYYMDAITGINVRHRV